ncbi:MAG: hypothetical protein DRQ78_08045 [Epsilonproteobacteria bacterium]|nr:MAG: hypothetical protein DRQ78_08045 [Campylobacterota bacterium]
MKKETLKELGKYFLDISKILIALTLISPIMKDASFSFGAISVIIILWGVGMYLTNKGAKE